MNSKKTFIALLALTLLSTSCAGWQRPHHAEPEAVCREMNVEQWSGVHNMAILGTYIEERGDPDHISKAIRVFGSMLKRCFPERFVNASAIP